MPKLFPLHGKSVPFFALLDLVYNIEDMGKKVADVLEQSLAGTPREKGTRIPLPAWSTILAQEERAGRRLAMHV